MTQVLVVPTTQMHSWSEVLDKAKYILYFVFNYIQVLELHINIFHGDYPVSCDFSCGEFGWFAFSSTENLCKGQAK